MDLTDPDVRALVVGLLAIETLIANSEGVYRLGGRSGVTAWTELRRGGRLSEWIGLFDEGLVVALATCESTALNKRDGEPNHGE